MTTAILLAVLVPACIYGGYAYVEKSCGPAADAAVPTRPRRRKCGWRTGWRAARPYTAVLQVDGMTCSNCVRRVENALNRLDGVWAEADLGQDGADAHEAAAGGPGACGRGTGRGVQVREIKREEPDEGLESDRDRKE